MAAKSPVVALDKLKASASRKPKALPVVVEQKQMLPPWVDAVRGIPNAVLRGALFTVSKERAIPKERELIATAAGVEVRYTGTKRLNQTDLDLWQMLLHLARVQPLGNTVEFSAYALLKELGRGTGGKDRRDLKSDIARLTSASVEVTRTGSKKKAESLRLIQKYERDEDTQQYKVVLHEDIFKLYDDGYTLIDWEHRKALKSNKLAQWLQGFYASHESPFPYKVETLKKLCGSSISRLADFRIKLRIALDELVKVGSIRSWSIDADLVKVVNKASLVKRLAQK